MGFFDKIKQGLGKTKKGIDSTLNSLFSTFRTVDEEFLENLLDTLIMADVSVQTAESIIDKLRRTAKLKAINSVDQLRMVLAEIIAAHMDSNNAELDLKTKPSLILVIGVNGVGKTTSIAKLAYILKNSGKKVILGAADTFRAAAADQLEIWANRVGVDVVKHNEGSDPAAVVFDTIAAGKSRGADVIIVDTAGRLHNKKNLMNELSKISRVIDRELPFCSKEILLVLDATTGQNAVNQAKEFKNAAGITGIILTKLDGTARGGVVLCVKDELDVPVKFIGTGEGIDDLSPFSPVEFAKALVE